MHRQAVNKIQSRIYAAPGCIWIENSFNGNSDCVKPTIVCASTYNLTHHINQSNFTTQLFRAILANCSPSVWCCQMILRGWALFRGGYRVYLIPNQFTSLFGLLVLCTSHWPTRRADRLKKENNIYVIIIVIKRYVFLKYI